jgi:hypothetical protein
MKILLALLLAAAAMTAQAQPRAYQQAELDALLAPVALYPDPLLSQVLVAATAPDDVREAAAWLAANPNLRGDDAVRAAEPMPWDPSVKALLAYPELLARMNESPQWLADLGAAFLAQEPQVMDTVQTLRRRAQAAGFLQSDGYQSVLEQDSYVVVQPAQTYIAYVPWYNPLVVYGPWWWHAHRPIAWRPWQPRAPVFLSVHVHRPRVDWRHRHIQRVLVSRPIHVQRPVYGHRPVVTRPAPPQRPAYTHNRVYQTQTARPIVQGAQPGARPIVQGARLPERPGSRESFQRGGRAPGGRLYTREESQGHRDAGGRHPRGAGRNAPHARPAH